MQNFQFIPVDESAVGALCDSAHNAILNIDGLDAVIVIAIHKGGIMFNGIAVPGTLEDVIKNLALVVQHLAAEPRTQH